MTHETQKGNFALAQEYLDFRDFMEASFEKTAFEQIMTDFHKWMEDRPLTTESSSSSSPKKIEGEHDADCEWGKAGICRCNYFKNPLSNTPELSGSTGKEKEPLEIFQRCRVCNGSGKLMSTQYECATCGGTGGAMRTLREPIKEEAAEELIDYGAQIQEFSLIRIKLKEKAASWEGISERIFNVLTEGVDMMTAFIKEIEDKTKLTFSPETGMLIRVPVPAPVESADKGEGVQAWKELEWFNQKSGLSYFRISNGDVALCPEFSHERFTEEKAKFMCAALNSAQRSGDEDLSNEFTKFVLIVKGMNEIVEHKYNEAISNAINRVEQALKGAILKVDKRVSLTDEEIENKVKELSPDVPSAIKDEHARRRIASMQEQLFSIAKWVRSHYEDKQK